jgi:tRNA A-37 threonylcarbamoyl transferase component Bud32
MLDLGQIRAGAVFCGRYRVDRLLKAGGMGAVYVAEHTATRRKVALKLMRPEIVANEGARTRFAQEAQASGIIESANIVDVYDAGIDPETQVPFIAMELLAGKELGDLVLERGALPAAEVADYVAQTARALDRAHAAGVIHRDLKPENLFLAIRDGEPPRVKILDFGIAKFLASSAAETRAAGTPLYMAPEQSRKGSSIGPHTDVWALGLIAYTLLVGRPYWLADDLNQLFGEIFAGDYESPSARAARAGVRLPASFDGWFFRCVDPDPARRFQRAGEAAASLAAVLGISLDHAHPSAVTGNTFEEAPTQAAPVRSLVTDPRAAEAALGLVPTPPPVDPPAPRAHTLAAVAPPPPRRRARAIGLGALSVVLVAAAALGWVRLKGGLRGPNAALALSLGSSDATCSLLAKGVVRCLGARLDRKGSTQGPEVLALEGPAVELALGKHHGCARMQNGTAQCWGDNSTGQLGDGTTRPHAAAEVPGLRAVVQIASSLHGSCARLAGGAVKCWGGNKYGQLGDGSKTDRLAPADVDGARGAISLALGEDHACALFDGGKVRCWGRNADGELGDGTNVDRPSPAPVAGVEDAAALALGGHFTCALGRDGGARCWGSNADGELGDGTTAASRSTPAPVAGLDGVTQLSAGWRHACARLASGATRCWGLNAFGQLGDGTTTTRPVPVPIAGAFAQIVAGHRHTCGVRDDGATLCWGRNEEGQLGDGTTQNRLEPVLVKW